MQGSGAMTDDIELLHCPFCGSSDSFVERADLSSSYVFCGECSAKGPTECGDEDDEEIPGAENAIAMWNQRAIPGVSHE